MQAAWAEDQRHRTGEGARAGGPLPRHPRGRTRSHQRELCLEAGRAPRHRKTTYLRGAPYSPLKDPADVLWRPVLWRRCGRNHADWPQIGREIPIRKVKRVRSRYPESQEGSREETNSREENQPWAEKQN